MEKLKFEFHPIFIPAMFILIYFNCVSIFIVYILSLYLHELGHYLCAKNLGYKLNKIKFMPYGLSLNGYQNITNKHQSLIAICGPLVNIIIVLITIGVWWYFPSMYVYTYNIVSINMFIFLFNILPIFPLDGGRLLISYITNNKHKKAIFRVMSIVCILLCIVLFTMFMISIFYQINYSLLFMAFFIMLTIFDNKNKIFYDDIYKLHQNNNKPIPIKRHLITKNTSLSDITKCLSNDYYCEFIIIDKNGNIINIINQDKIKRLL